MNETSITERDALTVLRQVRFALGRNYKSKIRDAWMDGNYNRDGLQQWDSQLQRIRNVFGPSWLAKTNPKSIPYWIKERHNPQLGTYYVPMGCLSKTAAAKHEKSLYGDNYMLRFETEAEYTDKLAELRKAGKRVQ